MKPKGQYANRQHLKYNSYNKTCEYSLTSEMQPSDGEFVFHRLRLLYFFSAADESIFNSPSVSRNPASVLVTCKTCTPGQTTELTCYICEITKGLTEFAKNQRKDPDRARCLKCITKVLETEPDMSPPSSDAEEEEDTDDEDVCFYTF